MSPHIPGECFCAGCLEVQRLQRTETRDTIVVDPATVAAPRTRTQRLTPMEQAVVNGDIPMPADFDEEPTPVSMPRTATALDRLARAASLAQRVAEENAHQCRDELEHALRRLHQLEASSGSSLVALANLYRAMQQLGGTLSDFQTEAFREAGSVLRALGIIKQATPLYAAAPPSWASDPPPWKDPSRMIPVDDKPEGKDS